MFHMRICTCMAVRYKCKVQYYCVLHIFAYFYITSFFLCVSHLNWNNFIFLQEKRIEEERIKMQKDFEQEQEKSRRKEEEVKCSIST